jgi:ribosomal protein S18 acetylase RimI-like enzyme
MSPVLKVAQQKDLTAIAHCHKIVFPNSLTSKMGEHYLSKVFSWYLSTDKAFLFFLQQEGQVIGYAGGILVDGTLAHGSASSMTQYTFNDAIKALLLRPWLLLHPDFLSRYALFARNIVTRIKNKFSSTVVRSAPVPPEPYAGLVVIGIHPTFQGKGYGSSLLNEFEKIVLQNGFKKMILTVNSDNTQAIKSYQRNGWDIKNSNQKSTSMEKRLS